MNLRKDYRKTFIYSVLVFLLVAGLAFGATYFKGYGKTARTGGAASALDGIDGDDLADKYIGLVPGTAPQMYLYMLDDDAAAAESDPDVIEPDANPGTKDWLLMDLIIGTLAVEDGAEATPSIINEGDPDTGIWFPAADTMAFSAGGGEAVRIESDQQIAIQGSSALTPLDIQVASGGTGYGTVTNYSFNLGATGGNGLSFGDFNGFKVIQSFGGEPLILNPAGNNVGIATTSPDGDLEVSDVSDDAIIYISTYDDTDTDNSQLIIRTADNVEAVPTATDTGDYLGQITFQGYDNDSFDSGAEIRAVADANWGAAERGTELGFYTRDGAGALTKRVVIKADGDVEFTSKIVNSTTTVTAAGPTDNLDVSGVNVVFIDTNGNNVTIGGMTGGESGQVLQVVVIDAGNNSILENAEGTGNQDIYLNSGGDETLTAGYGGWTLVCNGTHWYEVDN